MIVKEYGRYKPVCDICGEAADEDFDEFMDAVDYKKQNGWKSQRYEGVWMDVCPECQEEE